MLWRTHLVRAGLSASLWVPYSLPRCLSLVLSRTTSLFHRHTSFTCDGEQFTGPFSAPFDTHPGTARRNEPPRKTPNR